MVIVDTTVWIDYLRGIVSSARTAGHHLGVVRYFLAEPRYDSRCSSSVFMLRAVVIPSQLRQYKLLQNPGQRRFTKSDQRL
jgi:hypothetical protein